MGFNRPGFGIATFGENQGLGKDLGIILRNFHMCYGGIILEGVLYRGLYKWTIIGVLKGDTLQTIDCNPYEFSYGRSFSCLLTSCGSGFQPKGQSFTRLEPQNPKPLAALNPKTKDSHPKP